MNYQRSLLPNFLLVGADTIYFYEKTIPVIKHNPGRWVKWIDNFSPAVK